EHSLVATAPALAAVGGLEDAGGGDGDEDAIGVPRVDDDGVDAGGELATLGGRGAEPVVDAGAVPGKEIGAPRFVVPQRPVEREALAAVGAGEQAAGNGADVDAPRRAEGDHPQLEQLGVDEAGGAAGVLGFVLAGDEAADVAGALGIGDLGGVLPALAAVARARQLGAPVAVTEQGPQGIGVGIASEEVDADAGVTGQSQLPL